MNEQMLKQQFITPPDEFTPIPFWFWNDALTKEELIRQIRDFAEKGVMGFVIHPRMGIPDSIPYLSDSYMDLVEAAVQEAARLGMTVILYDEAMYPSGSAKGLVVHGNPEYASRGLKMAEFGCDRPVVLSSVLEKDDLLISAQAVRKQDNRLPDSAATVVLQPVDGAVSFHPPAGDGWSILLFIETYSKGTIRGVHVGEDDGQPNAPASADLLNPDAVRTFIRLTHERYYERLSRYFGNTIQAMFTDEPDILGRRHRRGLRPWTRGFLECLQSEGCRETDLPLLWLDGAPSDEIRRMYRKAVQKRLTSAYYKPLSDWCGQHGIALTGHPAGSDDIGLLEHFQIPGQDVVWRWVAPEDGKALEGKHSTAAKCSSDAARHRGRRRNLNEVLGVCGKGNGWHLTADDMKWYMDWLLVRGVNMLSPHAFYYSVETPLQFNERPPDVGPNNIWWPHYKRFAQYVKRMSWLMTDSRNETPVAVLCREDSLSWQAVKPLYENQIEFNYLEESLLQTACRLEEGQLRIAGQAYSVLLVEGSGGWMDETVQALRRFQAGGGRIILLEVSVGAPGFPFSRVRSESSDVVSAVEAYISRPVTIQPACSGIRISRLVKEGQHFVVLVNEGEQRFEGNVRVRVTGGVEQWDAWEGSIVPANAEQTSAGLTISVALARRQSIVFRIDPNAEHSPVRKPAEAAAKPMTLALVDGWRVEAAGFPVAPAGLGSWTDGPGMESFSGSAAYRTTFTWNEENAEGRMVLLDLGEVHELAEVWLNGQPAGVSFWHPYSINIAPYINHGKNELTVIVTNSLANRYNGIGVPSGLLGPVNITWK